MSRHGYRDDIDDPLVIGAWRGQVASAIRGKRGQAFLQELAREMDAMPVKELIANELINQDGDCCTIGVVCKARNIDVSEIDYEDPEYVAVVVGIARPLAAEIAYLNDDWDDKTPEDRWRRMRAWVASQIKIDAPANPNE